MSAGITIPLPDQERATAFFAELQTLCHRHGYGLGDVGWEAPVGRIPSFMVQLIPLALDEAALLELKASIASSTAAIEVNTQILKEFQSQQTTIVDFPK